MTDQVTKSLSPSPRGSSHEIQHSVYSEHLCLKEGTEGRWILKYVGSFPRKEEVRSFLFSFSSILGAERRPTACPTKVQPITFHLSGVVETCQRKGEEEKGKGMNMLFVSMI